jgi:hypothetical protein
LPCWGGTGGRQGTRTGISPGAFSVKVEDSPGARKFGDAGACNGTLDLDLTLATIRQAQPGATTHDEIHLWGWILLEYPRPCRIGAREGIAGRLDDAVALDFGRALADRRAAVVTNHDPRTIGQTDMGRIGKRLDELRNKRRRVTGRWRKMTWVLNLLERPVPHLDRRGHRWRLEQLRSG